MITFGYGFTADYINWSCPSELRPYEDAYLLRKKERDTEMYFQGLYFRDAITCTVGNMFAKKGSKPIEYPKETYMTKIEHERKENNGELTEEEKIQKTKLLFANLQSMQANFNLTHGKT